jgi:superfamily II DNA or RNA helicase
MSEVKTYLGQKGYTIYKNSISDACYQTVCDELRVAPHVPKTMIKVEKFPIFRESTQKLYVPRYYGETKFGQAQEIQLTSGNNINLEFKGNLRDYQENIIQKYMESVKNSTGGGLLEIPCGRGKTVMALKIISLLSKKTLIIVHKSFLLNQWIERMEEFLPGARIGKIQGQICDIEDKDIVIGMLQSLSMKEYPYELFSSFGLTVVDEVHHIAAEVFVRSLFKIVTPCVLGLSATMQRKDGLSKVFKMFLGSIIYKEKREGTDNVIVRAYDYQTNDEDFNKMEYDFKGNPKYSTMISKLCNFKQRSDFIVNIVEELYKSNNEQQIMILAHNKNLLTYFYKEIERKNIATVGYYVGGMKEKDLKISETKKIIIATYAMASEALDIKTLTTLVMATPKTDVTQSIGRILRSKHLQPIVVDIIDQHDVFLNQYRKRCIYYKKEKYTVFRASSNDPTNLKEKQATSDNNPLKGKCLIKL